MDGVECLAGRYRLIERLGAGGMSVVWRGHDDVLGRPVAVKLLAPKFATDPASRERIRAEARAAARLNHPYITDVYDYGESDVDGRTVPFVVMELVEGVPLDDHLAGGAMPWRAVVEFCAQIAAALAAVHERGLVHRDVKPANIMLTAAGAKLVDFGISAEAGAAPEGPGQLYGTPAYLAPERLDGGPADAASDVYALGLVLYKALTGDLPWDADTTTQMLRAHCYVDPAPLPRIPGLPGAVAGLCQRSLSKRPTRRPSTVEVAGTLAAVAGLRIPPVGGLAPARADASAGSPTDLMTQTRAVGVPLVSKLSEAAARVRAALPRPRTPLALRPSVVGVGVLGVTAAVAALGAMTWGGSDAPTGNPAPAQAAAADGAGAAGGAGSSPPPRPGCRVEYRTRADTGGQFIVDLTVANTGQEALPHWALAFDYGGDQRIMSVSGAHSTQDGGSVVLSAPTPLAAGATATVSLVGSYSAGNPMPSGFELAGQPCSEQLVGAAAPQVGAGGPATGDHTPGGPAGGPAPAGPAAGGPKAGHDKSGPGGGGKGRNNGDDDDDDNGGDG
jgi:eukaryotic-like serine/threonine-protein kinase